MNPSLDTLIDRFRRAQDLGVVTLTKTLGIPCPASNREWVRFCAENGLYEIRHIRDVGIYAHGYGIELTIDGKTIDFDWGDRGEPDGFDAWRLWNFRNQNCTAILCNYTAVDFWLEDAFHRGLLVKDSHLYYDPKRRAS